MPETFLADLDDLVATFEKATRYRTAGRNDQTAARARMEAALESVMEAVRKLDVIVANRLHDDAVTMAVWKRARRVGYPGTGLIFWGLGFGIWVLGFTSASNPTS